MGSANGEVSPLLNPPAAERAFPFLLQAPLPLARGQVPRYPAVVGQYLALHEALRGHRSKSKALPASPQGLHQTDKVHLMDFQMMESWEAIRTAVRDVCRKYPGAYWRDLDQRRAYSGGVRQRADPPRLAVRAHSRGVRRRRPWRHRGEHCAGGGEPLRRQRHRMPRPDVRDGHPAQARLGGTEAPLPAGGSPAARYASRPSRSPSPTPAPRPPASRPPPCAGGTSTWSTAKRSSPHGCRSRT